MHPSRTPPAVALADKVTVAKSAAMEMLGNLDMFQNSNGILFFRPISVHDSSPPDGHRTILVEH